MSNGILPNPKASYNNNKKCSSNRNNKNAAAAEATATHLADHTPSDLPLLMSVSADGIDADELDEED